jgi:hypothetical protein
MHATHLLPLTLFSLLATSTANTIKIQNSCSYPVHVQSIPGEGGAAINVGGMTAVQSGSDWNFDYGGGAGHLSSIKISKSESLAKGLITQLEYTYDANGQLIWYDISLEDCTDGKDHPVADRCPGWDGGMTLSSGGSCGSYHCAPGEYCWTQVYWYSGYDGGGVKDENGNAVSPNTNCAADQGLVFQLCSG